MTQTETHLPDVEEGDHDKFAHYVTKEAWERGYLSGEPIIALCGKVWVPTLDPNKYPVCPTCIEVKEREGL